MTQVKFIERDECPFKNIIEHETTNLENFATAYDFDGKTGN